jgi:hypothetical protein
MIERVCGKVFARLPGSPGFIFERPARGTAAEVGAGKGEQAEKKQQVADTTGERVAARSHCSFHRAESRFDSNVFQARSMHFCCGDVSFHDNGDPWHTGARSVPG